MAWSPSRAASEDEEIKLMRSIRGRWVALGVFVGLALGGPASAADKVRVLIIDGQNNHDWRAMTPPMKEALGETGRFEVDVVTTPEKSEPAGAWDSFRPDFARYDVVLSNYNGQPWPEEVQKGLEAFVAAGGGLVVVHAANNAFAGWPEWNKMIGLGWRDNKFGERVTLDDRGRVVRTEKGSGPGAGHGPPHPYKVEVRDREHPITRGMPAEWMHPTDELYHGQRGPALDMQILATAYSAPEQKGTGAHEPMLWVIPYGKGRVVTCLLGHVMRGDTTAIRCVGFRTIVARGCEWAATGEVTLPIPADFPTASEARLAPPAK